MKRIFALLMALCLCASLALCVVSCDNGNGEEETTVATTEAPTTENVTTEAPTEEATTEEATTEAAATGYTVRVVDTDGNPVVGAFVMVCKGEICSMPVATDADGYAKFPTITDEGRQAKIGYELDGYVIDTTKYFDFEAGSFEMTITVEKAA